MMPPANSAASTSSSPNVSALAIGQDEASWNAGFATDLMGTVRAVNAAMPFLEKSMPPASS